jgi:hypothetical protein
MSQHDYVIGNDTAANVRADINTALLAIASNNSGASAPATTYANQWWYDSTNDILKIRSEANDAWISVAKLDQTLDQFFPIVGGVEVTATGTELNFVDGVTSAIQTQLDAKAALASPALTGTPTAPTASNGTNTTQIATTAFVLANVPAGTTIDYQTFTASGTWTKPAGVSANASVIIELWGGGGAGACCGTAPGVGAGGGGGGCYMRLQTLASALTSTVAVTIGAGGIGNASTSIGGGNGGNSTFGSYLTAFGGAGAPVSDFYPALGGNGGGTAGAGVGLAGLGTVNPASRGTLWGGGGGGSPTSASAVSSGAGSEFGGGGGGGVRNTIGFSGGISIFGGAGGAANGAGVGFNGTAPAGGGGAGKYPSASGSGASGEARIYVIG